LYTGFGRQHKAIWSILKKEIVPIPGRIISRILFLDPPESLK